MSPTALLSQTQLLAESTQSSKRICASNSRVWMRFVAVASMLCGIAVLLDVWSAASGSRRSFVSLSLALSLSGNRLNTASAAAHPSNSPKVKSRQQPRTRRANAGRPRAQRASTSNTERIQASAKRQPPWEPSSFFVTHLANHSTWDPLWNATFETGPLHQVMASAYSARLATTGDFSLIAIVHSLQKPTSLPCATMNEFGSLGQWMARVALHRNVSAVVRLQAVRSSHAFCYVGLQGRLPKMMPASLLP